MQNKKVFTIVGLVLALGCIAAVKTDAPVYVTKLVPTSADFFVMIDAADGKQKKTPVSNFPALSWGTGLSSSTADGVTTVSATHYTLASGTAVLGTSAISSGACATAVTVSAPGVLTTDFPDWGFNGDPTSTTGYSASVSGMLTIIAYPTTDNVNFKVCNNTAASVTPGALTLNWRVRR